MDIVKTIRLQPGIYVVAVSGGVDSMVLLDLMVKLQAQTKGLKLIVAHFDHGIRPDSAVDKRLVEQVSRNHKLPFVYAEGNLGPETSEDEARKARYEFLHKVKSQAAADAIITAHHLDDVIETATHNILRGTGRRGVSSLMSRPGTIRPLLHLPKSHLINHAKTNDLVWREDSTNKNLKIRRNYLRHVVLPSLKAKAPEKYEELKRLIKRQHDLNQAIDRYLNVLLHLQPHVKKLSRYDIAMLPHAVARETVAHWLRNNGARDFNRTILENLTIKIKSARPRTFFVINNQFKISFDKKHAELINHLG